MRLRDFLILKQGSPTRRRDDGAITLLMARAITLLVANQLIRVLHGIKRGAINIPIHGFRGIHGARHGTAPWTGSLSAQDAQCIKGEMIVSSLSNREHLGLRAIFIRGQFHWWKLKQRGGIRGRLNRHREGCRNRNSSRAGRGTQ